jgi:uncharacterized membrane protein YraQ (UPF0718 family)
VPVAALLGILVPVCDCGVVPTARSLLRSEFGLAPALAFLVGAPVINPIVLITTAAGFGGNYTIAIARLTLTYIVAVGVGVLALLAFGDVSLESLVLPIKPSQPIATKLPVKRRRRTVTRGFRLPPALGPAAQIAIAAGDELIDLGRFLILGALVAAAVQTFVPQAPLMAISQSVLISTLSLMLLASILSVCSISDAPVAAGFLGIFAPGAVFAFMIFGQIIDLKNAAMLLGTFRRRVVIFLAVSSALLVLAVATLVNIGI